MGIYKDDSIQSLEPLEFVRLRPNVYAGDTTYSTQLFVELFSNALDEHNLGHGNSIHIGYNKELNCGYVIDDGQGIPVNIVRDDGKTVLEAAFSVLNTSGKYQDDGVYEGTSLGSYGLGGKLVTFLSHKTEVLSKCGGKSESVRFTEGVFKDRETEAIPKPQHGLGVWFYPSEEFFTHREPEYDVLRKLINDVCCLCPNLSVDLTLDGDKQVYTHPNGISDLLSQKVSAGNEATKPFVFSSQSGKQKLDFGLQYSNGNGSMTTYVNYGMTDTGPHITAVKSVITKIMNAWARENKLFKKNEDNLDGASLQDGMVVVFNLVSPGVTYDAQVKSRVTSNNFVTFINETLSRELEKWLDNNPADGRAIIEKALISRRAAEAAKKARDAVKNGKKKLKIANMPSKLADCNSRNRSECDLYLTEGDSASGGAKLIRNSSTQGVMGLKGKVLNVLVSKPDQILKNAEICDILKALGLDYNYENKKINVEYNEKKLRYGKIIIAADRDPDGGHICALLLTLFWTLIPDLILNGKIYIAKPPLYKAEWGQDKFQYIQDKKALEAFRKKNKNFTLTYFKGLGEASPEELGQMIMDPKTRNLELVSVENVKKAEKILNNLMGKDTKAKKEFVFNKTMLFE